MLCPVSCCSRDRQGRLLLPFSSGFLSGILKEGPEGPWCGRSQRDTLCLVSNLDLSFAERASECNARNLVGRLANKQKALPPLLKNASAFRLSSIHPQSSGLGRHADKDFNLLNKNHSLLSDFLSHDISRMEVSFIFCRYCPRYTSVLDPEN